MSPLEGFPAPFCSNDCIILCSSYFLSNWQRSLDQIMIINMPNEDTVSEFTQVNVCPIEGQGTGSKEPPCVNQNTPQTAPGSYPSRHQHGVRECLNTLTEKTPLCFWGPQCCCTDEQESSQVRYNKIILHRTHGNSCRQWHMLSFKQLTWTHWHKFYIFLTFFKTGKCYIKALKCVFTENML